MKVLNLTVSLHSVSPSLSFYLRQLVELQTRTPVPLHLRPARTRPRRIPLKGCGLRVENYQPVGVQGRSKKCGNPPSLASCPPLKKTNIFTELHLVKGCHHLNRFGINLQLVWNTTGSQEVTHAISDHDPQPYLAILAIERSIPINFD
jgi:hypothetical protein